MTNTLYRAIMQINTEYRIIVKGGHDLYKNLIVSLKVKRIPLAEVARLMKVHPDTVSNKINGLTAFTIDEAELIWKIYFPEMDYWWLFRKDAIDKSA